MGDGVHHLRYVEEPGDSRRGDRRNADRRAPRRFLDPLFAATLVNQVAKPETSFVQGYADQPKRIRAGIAFDLKA